MQIATCRAGLPAAQTWPLLAGPAGPPPAERGAGQLGSGHAWFCVRSEYSQGSHLFTQHGRWALLVWGRSPCTRPSRCRADHASTEARVLEEAFSLSEPICLLTSELQAAYCEPVLLEELLGFATRAVGRGRRPGPGVTPSGKSPRASLPSGGRSGPAAQCWSSSGPVCWQSRGLTPSHVYAPEQGLGSAESWKNEKKRPHPPLSRPAVYVGDFRKGKTHKQENQINPLGL